MDGFPEIQFHENKQGFQEKRPHRGPSLAYDDGAGLGDLIAVDLDAKPLPNRIPTVLCAPSSFLVCAFDG